MLIDGELRTFFFGNADFLVEFSWNADLMD